MSAAAPTVDLTLSSDEEEDAKPQAAPSPSSAADVPNDNDNNATNQEPVMIDLSDAPPTAFELQSAQYAARAQQELCQQQKKKRKRAPAAAAVSPEDVIDLEAPPPAAAAAASSSTAAAAAPMDEDASYKQDLGPLRMDFVTQFHPPHTFINTPHKKLGAKTASKIFQELLEYKLNLPCNACSSIFVRAMESRLDLIRVAVTGPAPETPYAHGIYLFDVHLYDYPARAPKVQFLTTGGGAVRFNPNLYACGKVCLSLLGTWEGPGWIPNKSTLLQVLVSIQGLVLVKDPFFNEPGYSPRQPGMMQRSANYNRNIESMTLQYAIRDFLRGSLLGASEDTAIATATNVHPSAHYYSSSSSSSKKKKMAATKQYQRYYPEFAEICKHHFANRADQVRTQIRNWTSSKGKTTQASTKALGQEVEVLLDQAVAAVAAAKKK